MALFILVAIIALLVLIPTRRLFTGGWTGWPLLLYFLLVTGLAVLVAEVRGPARFLVPILVVAYIGPFVTVRAGLARAIGGRARSGRLEGDAGAVVRRVDAPLLPRPDDPRPDDPESAPDDAGPDEPSG